MNPRVTAGRQAAVALLKLRANGDVTSAQSSLELIGLVADDRTALVSMVGALVDVVAHLGKQFCGDDWMPLLNAHITQLALQPTEG